jgi:glycosyltransferase involved in cell wall biosynthesis
MLDESIINEIEPQTPKPPRVAILASRQTLSEFSLYLKYLLVGLADESVPAILVCPPRSDVVSIVPPAFEVLRHPALDMPLLEFYNLKLLLSKLFAFRPQVLHCLCESKSYQARWLARHLNINYAMSVNSITNRFHYLSISPTRCRAILAPSRTIAESFINAYPKFSDQIHQINIGTFVSSSTACFSHPDRLPGIVVASPLDNPQSLDNLFLSLHRLAIENYQFMVVLVGQGKAEKQIRKKLRSLGLLRVVTIVPRLAGLDSALSATDIFINPRPCSSFNTLLLAAMSSGTAVASCKGGADDLIVDGKTAFTFNPDDQLSIYNCLKEIFDKRELARQIASSAQQNLLQNYRVSDMVSQSISIYRQTAGAPVQKAESSAA